MSKPNATTEKSAGRHCDEATSYKEFWAKRHPQSQEAVERDRLKKGFAKHRSHLFPLLAQSAGIAS
ncbi:hypothetical protein [Arthrobacter sp. GMC3]|uniref:hypothetical protein n=1 Tax=Arthrobacter sp. GMC3 TaxID=2058894 RepID=UPI000CE493AE|nr:hypothetical protein [Arthrobacter sp. GMC3]